MVVPIRNSLGPDTPSVSDEKKAALVGQILRGELTPREACASEGLSEIELKRWVRAYTRAARRAVDDQVAAALAAHGLDVDERPATEFSGTLDDMALAELIQTIQYGKKDALIRVEHEGEQSQLWCVDGDVVDAVSASLVGSAAVYRILSIEQGRLHADFAPVERPRTVHASTQALMLEAAKRSDECRQIRSRLGDTLNVYVPSASAPPESEIEPDQARLLAAFDGSRSIEQVVHDSEFPDLETLGLIARLLEQEWLVIKPFRRPNRPAKPELLAPTLSEGSFLPFAASLADRFSLRAPPPRLWASAVAGVTVVATAFAIGFYSAQAGDPVHEPAVAAVTTPTAGPVCGASLVALPGGLCLERTEVTAGEYQACVRSGACEPVQREFDATEGAAGAASSSDLMAHCNAGLAGRESYSVNCVTFQQARRYCEWRGGRLPTSSEWELAAVPGVAGALDLVGGLSEWTFEPSTGVDTARERVIVLGGGLDTGVGMAGTLRRLHMNANAQGRSVGFRCVVQADAHPSSALATNGDPADPER